VLTQLHYIVQDSLLHLGVQVLFGCSDRKNGMEEREGSQSAPPVPTDREAVRTGSPACCHQAVSLRPRL
jgi:hypothetical protein